ncbi:hypothetical protein DCCM_3782 [Desulfocucumis palustris]|uniref:Uncharacterized protein n=1 Tax=Desulfocucumis palustris TaxID=1898651 RepID=A0A2L2XEV4_9FIRM|nr:hypothetical protein DCCM_3782 [Desulfocucumis palustris]
MRRSLPEKLESGSDAKYFIHGEEPMHTRRKSLFIQQFL